MSLNLETSKMQLIGSVATFGLLCVLVVMTLIPMWRVGNWPVRLCDFFRMQICVLALGLLCVFLIMAWRSGWGYQLGISAALSTLIVAWQLAHIVRYTPLWPMEVPTASENADSIRLTVVNLKVDNQAKQEVLNQLQNLDVDLLLLIEIDAEWSAALSPLEKGYPHRHGVVRDNGVGLMLWSQLPLASAEVRYLVTETRPSIFARMTVGADDVSYVGLHPLPPGLPEDGEAGRHDSRIRDAELMLVADIVADDPDASWIVSGDFNDVAWSHATRMFQRISGLKDPRVGRGFYNSYHAKYPWLRFPIDQVFISSNGKIAEMSRFRPAGSDHFAITAEVKFTHRQPDGPTASASDVQEAQEMVAEGVEEAAGNSQ